MSAAALVDGAAAASTRSYATENEIRKLPAVQRVLDAPDAIRAEAIRLLVKASVRPNPGRTLPRDEPSIAKARLLPIVARKRVPMALAALLALLEDLTPTETKNPWLFERALQEVSGQIEFNAGKLDAEGRRQFDEAARRLLSAYPRDKMHAEELRRLRQLVAAEGIRLDEISDRDEVGRACREILGGEELSAPADMEFVKLLIAPAKTGKPPAAWAKQMPTVAGQAPSAPCLVSRLLRAAVDAPDTDVHYSATHIYRQFAVDGNIGILLNIVWTSAILRNEDDIPALRDLAAKCTKVVAEYGSPRSLTTSNACAHAIAEIGGGEALTALRTLERTVKHGAFVKEVGKAIESMASAEGKSRSELLETAVEDYGLDETGRRDIPFGAYTATVAITDNEASVEWRDGSAKVLKSAPAAVKTDHAADYKILQATLKSIGQTIAAERQRLDALLIENRKWEIADWQDHYLRHPVTGALARGLIWHFRDGDGDVVGLPRLDGTIRTVDGSQVQMPPAARVRLWHPLEGTPDDVRAWRQRIFDDRIRQPFKQSFRETYTVTPAELETASYSNRFASHVIRQVQARSLMKARGWSAVILAWWDDGIDHGVARKTYSGYGVRAEFFYDPIEDIQPQGSDSYPFITTDQVAFFEGDRRLDMNAVPLLVFSEAMRDVDLFVGVTTIGADPNWLDQGERRFDRYWHNWAFGDLSVGAGVRREVLAKLLPALKIADRCQLDDRHLVVRGDLRTYKIHLGSSNILMSPDDRYLCIVAARGGGTLGDTVYLPFDDDHVLSMVLSKAFLLADDRSITDPTIVRQIAG